MIKNAQESFALSDEEVILLEQATILRETYTNGDSLSQREINL